MNGIGDFISAFHGPFRFNHFKDILCTMVVTEDQRSSSSATKNIPTFDYGRWPCCGSLTVWYLVNLKKKQSTLQVQFFVKKKKIVLSFVYTKKSSENVKFTSLSYKFWPYLLICCCFFFVVFFTGFMFIFILK